MQVDKILIRGPNWVGDSVLAIPAMKAVRTRFPNAEITLLVRPWVAGLFKSAPFIDQVWIEPRPSSLGDWTRITRSMRTRRFDLGVLLPNSFESALAMFLGRVAMRLGYATDGRRLLLTDPVSPLDQPRHQLHYYLGLLKSLSITVERPSIEISATAEERMDARRLLDEAGISSKERFLVINPGAAYGSAKRWHEQRFAELGDRLTKQLSMRAAIVGSLNEKAVANEIRSLMKVPAVVLTGKTSLESLIGVLSECSLMVTNDSGPMHIAAALGTPTIAVFGPTDESVTGPFGPRTRIVKHPVDCSPCLLRECPIDHRCMTRVTVNDVYRAAMDLLTNA